MKRITLFFYYCYALQWPVQDTYIFSPSLAWDAVSDEGLAAMVGEIAGVVKEARENAISG